jgi:hypothetical protein
MRNTLIQRSVVVTLLVSAVVAPRESTRPGSNIADSTGVIAFDATLTPLGGGQLLLDDNKLVVRPDLQAPSGVSVPVGSSGALNVLLNPIEIPVSKALTATFRDHSGVALAKFEHVQTGANTTDLYLSLGEVSSKVVGPVTLETYANGERTYRGQLGNVPLQRIGSVESAVGAWAKTYHVLCSEGECTVFIDPDETTLQLHESAHAPVSFNYIKVSFKLDFEAVPSAIELVGNGVPVIEIVGLTSEPLVL